jgi:hypothetical protein
MFNRNCLLKTLIRKYRENEKREGRQRRSKPLLADSREMTGNIRLQSVENVAFNEAMEQLKGRLHNEWNLTET